MLWLKAACIRCVINLCSQDGAKPSSSSQPRKKAAGVARPPTLPVPREELKMVLCVNHSLGMGKGKIGAGTPHQSRLQQSRQQSTQQMCAHQVPSLV
jgi:hypothetical protein